MKRPASDGNSRCLLSEDRASAIVGILILSEPFESPVVGFHVCCPDSAGHNKKRAIAAFSDRLPYWNSMRAMFNILAIVSVCRLMAQTPDTGSLSGHVMDESHAGVPSAQVAVTGKVTRFRRTAQTDASGAFTIGGLPVSEDYAIAASRAGFEDASR